MSQNQTNTHHAVTPERVAEWIRDWAALQLRVRRTEIANDELLADAGMSSLQLAELAGALEDQFAVQLPVTVAWECRTVDELARYVARTAEGG